MKDYAIKDKGKTIEVYVPIKRLEEIRKYVQRKLGVSCTSAKDHFIVNKGPRWESSDDSVLRRALTTCFTLVVRRTMYGR